MSRWTIQRQSRLHDMTLFADCIPTGTVQLLYGVGEYGIPDRCEECWKRSKSQLSEKKWQEARSCRSAGIHLSSPNARVGCISFLSIIFQFPLQRSCRKQTPKTKFSQCRQWIVNTKKNRRYGSRHAICISGEDRIGHHARYETFGTWSVRRAPNWTAACNGNHTSSIHIAATIFNRIST